MFKKAFIAALGAVFLAIPFVSSAQTAGIFQPQMSATTNVYVLGTVPMPAPASLPCPSLSRSLSFGARGNDVTALQQFLSAQGSFNASATGYFGSLTKAALGRWQVQNGIIASSNAGFGIFGPLSRSYMLKSCGGITPVAQSFSADPQSGAAPLTTTFTTSDSITSSSAYSVNFGDGQTGAMSKGSCVGITAIAGGQGGIRCSYSVSHSYASAGTYAATLLKTTPITCPNNAFCQASVQTVGTATITVGSVSNAGANFSASPTSGAAPLSVQFTSSAPQGTSVGTTVNFGDGTSGSLLMAPVCSSCNALGMVSHTYASAGTYTATLSGGSCSCPANSVCNCPNMQIFGTETITVGSGGGSASNIQQVNAPGSVSLSQGGIAEIRNESSYFTLQSISSSSATIQVTPVGCWNSFPSDTTPRVRCMIAVMPIAPQTLSVGQAYSSANYSIALTGINNGTATFSISASSTI